MRTSSPRAVTLLPLLVALLAGFGCVSRPPAARVTGPWNLTALANTPAVDWGKTDGLVQEVFYAGEPLNGKPTRVFAYLGRPRDLRMGNPESVRRPAMLLVHGGGGKAFKEWAEHWAHRGYVALAMDLSGNGPDGRLPDGGPDQADAVKFRDFTDSDATNMWTYHAVAAVVRGHSLLRSLPDVDPERIGITGISWGGYLTCIVAGIDPRLKVAVPVYGCGFLGDNSVWTAGSLAAMTPEARQHWLRLFDPSQYLGGVRCPTLFLNGTTDFAYPLDSYQRSYHLVPPQHRNVSVVVDLPHGHIWTFPEVDAFVDSVLRKGKPPLAIFETEVKGQALSAAVGDPARLRDATLCYTTDVGPWQKRRWQTVPARIGAHGLAAELPTMRPLVAFLAATDNDGLRRSSEHVELPAR